MNNFQVSRAKSHTPVIPGMHYPCQGPCSHCGTDCRKANPQGRCEPCRARFKEASRLRRLAADRKKYAAKGPRDV